MLDVGGGGDDVGGCWDDVGGCWDDADAPQGKKLRGSPRDPQQSNTFIRPPQA